MTDTLVYVERVTSRRTHALFVSLTLVFLLLFSWRLSAWGFETWSVVLGCVSGYFLFCSVNYTELIIQPGEQTVHLKFGIFTWTIPLENIEDCFPDRTSLWRIGGAGIHFTPLGGRYRAMFNFLEYPRLVIALKVKRGLVQDIAFSTRQAEELMKLILDRIRVGEFQLV